LSPGLLAAAKAATAAGAVASAILAGAVIDLRRPPGDDMIASIVSGGEPLEWAGSSLAGGDVNGDGIPDLVIAAPGGAEDRPSRRGRLYVVYGRVTGPAKTVGLMPHLLPGLSPGAPSRLVSGADVVINGADDFDHLGRSLAVADVDGDGIADIVAGAPRADGPMNRRPDCGEVVILHGATSLPPFIDLDRVPEGVRVEVICGRRPGDLLGTALAAADLTGDGRADLAIGAPLAEGTAGPLGALDVGEVLIVEGAPDLPPLLDPAGRAAARRYGVMRGDKPGDQAGSAVAIGDFDGDGTADLAIGARSADGLAAQRPDAGLVYLALGPWRPGRSIALARDADAVFESEGIGDLGGGSLALADVDGDGRADLIIGAEFADGDRDARLDAGDVVVVAGRSRGALETLRPPPPTAPGAKAGTATPVTAPASEAAPRGPVPVDLRLMHGRGMTTFHGADPGDHTGVRGAFDLDGDGRAEIVVGAVDSSSLRNTRAGGGEIKVIAGRPGMPPVIDLRGDEGMALFGPTGNVHLGSSAAAVDLDGDGRPELAVAGPQAGQALSGTIWILRAGRGKLLRPVRR